MAIRETRARHEALGLDEDDLRVVYSTFHEGWNFESRLSAVLDHHRQLAPLAAEVGA